MESQKRVKILSSKTIYKSKWLTLRHDEIIKPDGSHAEHDVVERKDCVLIIPKKNNNFYMVKMYRYAVDSESWEFPQGFIVENESPQKGAMREIEEEVGLRPKVIKQIGSLWMQSGLSTQKMYIFFSDQFANGIRKLEDTESDLQTNLFTYEEIKNMVKKGEIQNSATLAALVFYEAYIVK